MPNIIIVCTLKNVTMTLPPLRPSSVSISETRPIANSSETRSFTKSSKRRPSQHALSTLCSQALRFLGLIMHARGWSPRLLFAKRPSFTYP